MTTPTPKTDAPTSGPGTRTPDDSGSYGHTPGVEKTSNEGKGTAPIGGPIGTPPYLDPATGQPVEPPAGGTAPAPAGTAPARPGVAQQNTPAQTVHAPPVGGAPVGGPPVR
jgi:hypothetical protein